MNSRRGYRRRYQMTWYKNNKGDKIWWLDNGPRVKGKRIFSFDKEKQFNLFRDYPQALTDEEKEIFDNENPYWANFFKGKPIV